MRNEYKVATSYEGKASSTHATIAGARKALSKAGRHSAIYKWSRLHQRWEKV
jgi:hypothetical protein